jgi:uroporphyrinogen-III decarboxylase
MAATSRELVYQSLNFENPERVPRQMWHLPWAERTYPQAFAQIVRDFPSDIIHTNPHYREAPRTKGDPFAVGSYIDEWGCEFVNAHDGIIGEVKNPMVQDWDEDWTRVRLPMEWLTADVDAINRDCDATDKFVLPGVCARPFERLQFLRGTEALYMDLMDPPDGMLKFIERMREFYCRMFELWGRTEVDGLFFIDDWGSQQNLLINPEVWREVFKPIYRDLCDIARSRGKKTFMHSDGHILRIYPELIEVGVDAVNSQLFCMGIENLRPYAGKITFWGEIDRQQVLPRGTLEEVDAAVRSVYENLWRDGGCIAQCEFGPGAKPENVRQMFESWNAIHGAEAAADA